MVSLNPSAQSRSLCSNAKHARKHHIRNREADFVVDRIEVDHRIAGREGLHSFRNLAVGQEEEARVYYTATAPVVPVEV